MNTILIALLAAVVIVIAYHTATHGRRGRRWGGFSAVGAASHARPGSKGDS